MGLFPKMTGLLRRGTTQCGNRCHSVLMSSRLRGIALAAAFILLLVAAGIGGAILLTRGSGPAHVAVDSSIADQCGQSTEAQRVVLSAGDGTRLGAAVVGSTAATRGVVVNYDRSQTLCDWLDQAQRLAKAAEAKVLIVDRRGTASSEGTTSATTEPRDVQTGVAWLRSNGVTEAVVLGSSMGSEAAAASVSGVVPRPCGVVLVSPAVSGESRAALLRSRVPVSITTETGNDTFLDNAVALLEESKSRSYVRLHQVATTDHSIGLLSHHTDAQDFVAQAVRDCSAHPA